MYHGLPVPLRISAVALAHHANDQIELRRLRCHRRVQREGHPESECDRRESSWTHDRSPEWTGVDVNLRVPLGSRAMEPDERAGAPRLRPGDDCVEL